jgi:phospholipase C
MFHRSIANQAIFAVMMLSTMLGTALMPAQAQSATTPIKHVVVIFQENVSFDHYFGVSTAGASVKALAFDRWDDPRARKNPLAPAKRL